MKYPNVTLGRVEAVWNKLGGEEGVDRFLRDEITVSELVRTEVESLLEYLGTAIIAATTDKFIAKDKFTKRSASVKISAVWDNFTTWFLSGDGKTEDPITEQTLRYAKLRQSSMDGPIITEIGGEAKAETNLSEMFSLMEKQKNGESGVLLNNGYANIFYIKDQKGVLRTVGVYWGGGGWDVSADSVGDPSRWVGGDRVFSRK